MVEPVISEEKSKELYKLFCIVVSDGIKKALEYISSKKYFGNCYNFPILSEYFFPNNMPSFSHESYDKSPRDYKYIFFKYFGREDAISCEGLFNYNELKEFIENNDDIAARTGVLNDEGEHKSYYIESIIITLIDRYFHIFGEIEFDEEKFIEIYADIYIRYFSESLPMDIAVPILMVDFEADEFMVNEDVYIKKMDKNFQLARIGVYSHGSGADKIVMGCATHLLVIKNYSIQNQTYKSFSNVVEKSNAYPLDIVNNFFASIRLTTGYDTGYAQLLCIPQGWADTYKAFLPPVYGASLRAYPMYFDNYIWLQGATNISNEQLKGLATTFILLSNENIEKIPIAIKRLNQCYLRDNQEDSILDAIIALEILLTDDDKGEITYKISTRMAAIVSIGKCEYTPTDIHKSMKKIYDYRSALVHGRKPKKNNELISLEKEKESIPVIQLAIEYLKITVKTLLENPDYLDIKKLDEYIIKKLEIR